MVATGVVLKESAKIRKIAFVGDHLPRKCGIATFTTDLAVGGTKRVPAKPVPVRLGQ